MRATAVKIAGWSAGIAEFFGLALIAAITYLPVAAILAVRARTAAPEDN